MTPLYCLIFLGLLLLVPVPLRLRLTYPLRQPPRLKLFTEISRADLAFGWRLSNFLRKWLRLTQLHCNLRLAGPPDVCALAAGGLLAALHSLAAGARCRNTNLQMQLTQEKTSAELLLKIYLPLWTIITAGLRLAAYLGRRRFKLNNKKII